jgi:hypothetical protein
VKMAVVWNVARCSLVEVDLRFTGAYCLHHQSHRPIRRNIPEDSHIHICRLEPEICNRIAALEFRSLVDLWRDTGMNPHLFKLPQLKSKPLVGVRIIIVY